MVDLRVTDDGELVIGSDGDLEIVIGDEELAQEVLFRLKTAKGDWVLSPDTGCDLERFIGWPNTLATRTLISQAVHDELTKDLLLIYPDIQCVADSDNSVLVFVEFSSVEDNSRVIQVTSQLDLREGLVFSRVKYNQL